MLLVLAITGALTLFDREIDALLYRHLVVVQPVSEAPLSLLQQEKLAAAAVPEGRIRAYAAPETKGHSATFTVARPDGGRELVFVDPWRGVLGTMDQESRLMVNIVSLHSSLMAGTTGNIIVELAACWTLVLIVTGLVLWWPTRWRFRGVVVPRLGSGTRTALRDFHAIPGALFASAVMFLVATGLPWSIVWGEGLSRISLATPHLFGPTPTLGGPTVPTATKHGEHASETTALPWTMRHHALPAGTGANGPLDLEQAWSHALQNGLKPARLLILYPSETGMFTAIQRSDRAEGQRVMHIDAGTGAIISDVAFPDYAPLGKAVEWGVSTHMGRQFGLANQMLGLATCLAIMGSVGTGVWMWWRRRPAGAFGAPARSRQSRLPESLSVLLVCLAILLPLVGFTILIFLTIDRLLHFVASRPSRPVV